jgi:hypothetical protein
MVLTELKIDLALNGFSQSGVGFFTYQLNRCGIRITEEKVCELLCVNEAFDGQTRSVLDKVVNILIPKVPAGDVPTAETIYSVINGILKQAPGLASRFDPQNMAKLVDFIIDNWNDLTMVADIPDESEPVDMPDVPKVGPKIVSTQVPGYVGDWPAGSRRVSRHYRGER